MNDDIRKVIFHNNFIITWYRLNTACFVLSTSIGKLIKIKIQKEAKNKLWKQYKDIRAQNGK